MSEPATQPLPAPAARPSPAAPSAIDRLVRLADAVFGPPDVRPAPYLVRRLAVVAAVAAIVLARRPDVVGMPQFWAEDGYIYFLENATLGFFPALAKLYNGYPNLIQRLVGFLGGLVAVADAPRLYTSSAIALTALSLSTFVRPAFRHVVRSDLLRALFCVGVVSMPFDREVLATPANLGWLLAIWLSLASLGTLPRAWWRVLVFTAAAACVVFSTPLAPVNLPLWALRGARGVVRRDRRDLVFALTLMGALVAVTLATSGMGANVRFTVPGGEFVHLTLASWWRFVVWRLSALVMSMRTATASPSGYVAVALLAGLVVAAAVARWRNLTALAVALYLFAGSVALELLGRAVLNVLPLGAISVRYTVFPTAMALLAVVVAIDGLPGRYWRAAATLGMGLLVAVPWRESFAIPPLEDRHWPRFAPAIAHALFEGCPAELDVPMNPSFAPLRIRRGRYEPQPVRADGIVARLAPGTTIRLALDASCDGLGEIDLPLGSAVAPQSVFVTVFDGQTPVASARGIEVPSLGSAWVPFCFGPIAGTQGKHLELAVAVRGGEPDALLSLFGDVGGRASVRHACRTPPASLRP